MWPNMLLRPRRTCQEQRTEEFRGPKPQSPNPKKNSPRGESNPNFEDPVSGSKTDPSADDTKNKQGPFLAPDLGTHFAATLATTPHAATTRHGPRLERCGLVSHAPHEFMQDGPPHTTTMTSVDNEPPTKGQPSTNKNNIRQNGAQHCRSAQHQETSMQRSARIACAALPRQRCENMPAHVCCADGQRPP